MASNKSKYSEVTTFLGEKAKDVSKPDSDVIKMTVNQADYQSFMAGRGVTKDMLKQVASAQEDYCNGNIEALTDIIVKNPKINQAIISTRTPIGPLQVRQTRKLDTHKPATGEPITKYGVISIKIQMKSHLDKELITSCMKAVEDSMK